MKGASAAIAFALSISSAVPAVAQAPASALVRPDITGSIGWLNVDKGDLSSSNDWYNRGLYGAVTFGWHWSPHLKTELEAAASRRADFYASRELLSDGIRSYSNSEYTFSTRRLTAGLLYQFGENAWVHSHVAAGVDFNWEASTQFDHPVYQYVVGRPATLVRPAARHPKDTDLHVRPFVAAGFKAYVTQRGFFRSDLRFVGSDGLDEVLWRFGFGVDF
jgi:hypothetical protein